MREIRTKKRLLRRPLLRPFGFLAALAVLSASAAFPQAPPPARENMPSEGPAVFLDWPGADVGFFKTEVPFVSFVSSLDEAEVHVVVQTAREGGRDMYTVTFTGLRRFESEDNTLTFGLEPGAGPEEVRKGAARTLKIGLVRYAAKTPVSRLVSVDFKEEVQPTAVEDKWNFWVFNLSANSFLDGQRQYSNGMYYGNLSANRVTPGFKIRMSVYGSLSKQKFTFEDEIIRGSSESFGGSGLFVKSLGEHWSAGVFLSAATSSYQNLDVSISASPALEYNVFPYSESTKKQLRLLYRIGWTGVRYREETIYLETSEGLFHESLSVALELKQPWGTVGTSLEGMHYFHDIEKYRLVLDGDVNIRLWRGLSFEFSGRYSLIRNQLSLPRGGASYEEVLLRQKELATGYSYYVSVGLNFTFGSTRSHVVNPRFGNGEGISISF
jgi:hypothetical protein